MKWAFLFCCITLWAAPQDNNSKPSPIGKKRSQTAEQAPVTPDFPKKVESKDSKDTTPGADTGTACYYRQKAALPGEPEPPPQGMTATSPDFPIGTRLKVTNLANNKTVVVIVSEHSAGHDRIVCLSQPAAEQLAFVKMGTAQVKLEKQ